MNKTTKRSYMWVILFLALAASNAAHLFFHSGKGVGYYIATIGFLISAGVAVYHPADFPQVQWYRLRSSPSLLGMKDGAAILAVALLIIGTAATWV